MSSQRWARLAPISCGAKTVIAETELPAGSKPNPVDLSPEGAWEPIPDRVPWNTKGTLYNPHVWSGKHTHPLTVILVHYNEREALARCLCEHGQQTLGRYQIIVADDGTSGGVDDVVRKSPRRDSTLVVVNPRKNPREWRNPATVLNMALAAVGGRFLMVMSAHIIPLRRENLQEQLDIQVRNQDRRVESSLLRGDRDTSGEVLSGKWSLDSIVARNLPAYPRGPTMIPTEHSCRIGGYSQCFQGWGGEDSLYHHQLRGLSGADPVPARPVLWLHLWHPHALSTRR